MYIDIIENEGKTACPEISNDELISHDVQVSDIRINNMHMHVNVNSIIKRTRKEKPLQIFLPFHEGSAGQKVS